jgi:amidohydrolase
MFSDSRNILELVNKNIDEIISHRRYFHKHPELSFKEFETSKYIKMCLTEFGIESRSAGETGRIAQIGNFDKCIALRADMDALPILEETGLEFESENKGVMHACGHDFHTSMLLGAAKIIKENEAKLKGSIRLIFQPGEEKIPGGAKQMISNGCLENPVPLAIFGQHINPEDEVGKLAVNSGYILASADELYWTISAKGSHAAQPHKGTDAVLASANLILTLNTLVNKNRDPLLPGLMSITSVHGGTATNIFPDEVKLMGTFRSFSEEWREKMHILLVAKSREICAVYGTNCELRIEKGYPSLFNNEDSSDFVQKTAGELLGKDNVLKFEPKMWAEDFAYYAQKVPATFWQLGVKPKTQSEMPPLHNAKLSPDESALAIGTAMFVKTAFDYFK